MSITVRYASIDGFSKARSFKTLAAARRFAVGYVGEHPEIGSYYAVSADGVGKVTAKGCSLAALFTDDAAADGYVIRDLWDGYEGYYAVDHGTRRLALYDTRREAEEHVAMARENDAYLGQDSAELRDLERELPF